MSECVACGRGIDATPVGLSRPLCASCQTRLGAGDLTIAAVLSPEVEDEQPSDAFVRQDRDADPVERFYRGRAL